MTTMAEPEWDQHSRDIAVALSQVPLCRACGRPTHICQDPAKADQWVVPDPARCFAATALGEKQKQYTEETNPIVQALVFGVRLDDASPTETAEEV